MSLRRLARRNAWLLLAALTSLVSAQDVEGPRPNQGMPFDLVSNFEIVVRGQIGGMDGLRFIVDTGSTSSVIDRGVAERLGLHLRPGTVINFDRNLTVERAQVPEVRVGPIRASGIDMMVTRLGGISEFAKDADGIIGMDVLGRTSKISIDYDRKRIFFELDERPRSEPSSTKAFVVPVVIQGTTMHLLVDTGLRYLLLYKDRVRKALPQLRTAGDPRDGLIGHLEVTQISLPGVQIFGPEAVTSVLLIDGNTGISGVDGYLGPTSLRARRLELDFDAGTLCWQ